MTLIDKLKNLNIPDSELVTLKYSDGTEVFVHNETEIEDALSETDVVATFAELIATPGLRVSTQFGDNVLDRLREDEHLESSIEKYDYKRGFCTLSANVKVPLSDIIKHSPYLSGWEISVKTDNGDLTLEA